jgi:hypothetical protein
MVSARFIEASDQMSAARAGGAGAHAKLAGMFGLAGGGKRRAFLMTDADPLDLASPNRVSERVERVANQTKDLSHADLFEHADQKFCNRL